jgi:hypothetical protein
MRGKVPDGNNEGVGCKRMGRMGEAVRGDTQEERRGRGKGERRAAARRGREETTTALELSHLSQVRGTATVGKSCRPRTWLELQAHPWPRL